VNTKKLFGNTFALTLLLSCVGAGAMNERAIDVAASTGITLGVLGVGKLAKKVFFGKPDPSREFCEKMEIVLDRVYEDDIANSPNTTAFALFAETLREVRRQVEVVEGLKKEHQNLVTTYKKNITSFNEVAMAVTEIQRKALESGVQSLPQKKKKAFGFFGKKSNADGAELLGAKQATIEILEAKQMAAEALEISKKAAALCHKTVSNVKEFADLEQERGERLFRFFEKIAGKMYKNPEEDFKKEVQVPIFAWLKNLDDRMQKLENMNIIGTFVAKSVEEDLK